MSSLAIRLQRLLLHAYPSAFRREFGADMVQLMIDQHRYEGRSPWRSLRTETFDAARSAPRMRLESPMNRLVVVTIAATASIVAVLVATVTLIPIAVLWFGAWFVWGRKLQPIAAVSTSRRWATWLVAGAVAIAVAIAIPAIDGGELNAFWWTAMFVSLLGGIAMAVVGTALAVSDRSHRLSGS